MRRRWRRVTLCPSEQTVTVTDLRGEARPSIRRCLLRRWHRGNHQGLGCVWPREWGFEQDEDLDYRYRLWEG